TPDNYNQAWWDLKARYQGVAPVEPRGEEFFDPGAKYHVPGNTPYTRYFLAHILQFQFYKSLFDAAGFDGPLHECSFYGNKAAGEKLQAMLSRGASQPWQQTLAELTGGAQLDASAVLEYFAPLGTWLRAQLEGKACRWWRAATGRRDTPPACGHCALPGSGGRKGRAPSCAGPRTTRGHPPRRSTLTCHIQNPHPSTIRLAAATVSHSPLWLSSGETTPAR